jgi:hypothetical protein
MMGGGGDAGVYLMEPSIDPAHEQQAAGRIHRLGQRKVRVLYLVLPENGVFSSPLSAFVCPQSSVSIPEIAPTEHVAVVRTYTGRAVQAFLPPRNVRGAGKRDATLCHLYIYK